MKDTTQYIKEQMQSTEKLMQLMYNDTIFIRKMEAAANACIRTLTNRGKILFAGNGGSAADSQHMAAEYVSRYKFDRPSLPAIALTTDTSILTAAGNDYGFDTVFERQINGLGNTGDVFFAYSTSGSSPNIVKALIAAKEKGIICIGMTGCRNGEMNQYCDIVLDIPSSDTPKIQEGHLVVGHLICGIVEDFLFGKQ